MAPSTAIAVDEESPLLLHQKLLNQVTDDANNNTSHEDHKESEESDEDEKSGGLTLSGAVSDSWDEYNEQLDKNPLFVKCITAFFVLGLGDLCGQGVEHLRGSNEMEHVDWIRAIRFGMFGLVGAPWAHYYFYFLDAWLPPTEKPFTWTTFFKLLIDQGLQAPALLAIMISALAILKGEGWEGVEKDMSDNYWTALIANWKLWIPASLINLAFVKPSLRVLYVNVVFFVWTIILSVMLNENHDP